MQRPQSQIRAFIIENFLFGDDSARPRRRRLADRGRRDRLRPACSNWSPSSRSSSASRSRTPTSCRTISTRSSRSQLTSSASRARIDGRLAAATCMRVENFLAAARSAPAGQDRAGRRRRAPDLCRARHAVRRPCGGAARGRAWSATTACSSSWTIAGEAAVSIFAVLKAGAVFSPINPSTKADKLALMLDNCRAAGGPDAGEARAGRDRGDRQCADVKLAVVAGQGNQARPHAGRRLEVSLRGCIARPRQPPPHGGIDIDLAMLIYTSGSTGRPRA